MAPVHFVPNPVSSLCSENESSIFADSCSNHCGNVVAFSNPEDLPSLVNPTSPPSLTSLEPLVAAPTKVGVPACSESESKSKSGPARLSSPLALGAYRSVLIDSRSVPDVQNSVLDIKVSDDSLCSVLPLISPNSGKPAAPE
ncbi:hypothetical protein Nepgr_033685 [Nepenthes gracilis]|uniref:Uncharacterized protein n=1 Tax=Nepenthes gracilis TaxID=150966 RepID=A0AAD3TMC3_NEPGR|nr:hypothetical protein Nepgr_033685 [Nepenthes gracilis]